jgi:DNA-binding SARP family transcriptional activator
MEFGLLGPLRIQLGSDVIAVQATKQRSLLAALILRVNRPVSTDELTDLLWGERPPAGAHGTVQAYVMRLRRSLGSRGSRLIRTVAGGYQFTAPPQSVDVQQFQQLTAAGERLAAAGQLPAASREFSRSIDLWRGEPLADIDSDWLRRVEVPRLAEQRLLAIERYLELDLELGHSRGPVCELRSLVAQHPLRERYWYLLMLALHRSGWRSEALDAYDQAADQLRRELGVEPGPELRDLRQALLAGRRPHRGSDSFRRDSGAELRDGAYGGDQFCREVRGETEAELRDRGHRGTSFRRELRGENGADRDRGHRGQHPALSPGQPAQPAPWARPCQLPREPDGFTGRRDLASQVVGTLADRGSVPLVVLSGPPGIGKTALAVWIAHQVRDRYPDGQLWVPLTPASEPAAVLTDLLLATGLPVSALPADPGQLAPALRARLADRRVLLVLDGAVGSGQVRPLLPGTPGCAVLVTSRNDLRGLAVSEGASRQVLEELSPAEAQDLLGHLLGPRRLDATPAAARRLAAACGHHPLALRIAAASLASRPDWSLRACAADLDQDPALRQLAVDGDPEVSLPAAFQACYDALDPQLRRGFGRLGLLPPGRPFTLAEAAAALGVPEETAALRLDQLAARSMIYVAAPGRYRLLKLLHQFAAAQVVMDCP